MAAGGPGGAVMLHRAAEALVHLVDAPHQRRAAAVAELLRRGPMTGDGLVQRSGGALSRGTVYPTLARMEGEGAITSTVLRQGQRLYQLACGGVR